MPLTPAAIAAIKSTAPALAAHGNIITTAMYKRMLPNNPTVSTLFNPTHQVKLPGDHVARQPQALAQTLLAYAQNIDNVGALHAAVERIAHKHVSVHILPEHYPIVGENFLASLKDVLGEAATPEIIDAWAEGYRALADIFIARERALREEKKALPGGWEGWRDFVVVKKVVESTEITSFHLAPKDGNEILSFLPGQYVGIRIETPGMTTQRNYSLSNAPGQNQYRITVKKEGPAAAGCPMGKVSSYLHDQVHEGDILKMTVPSGDFHLDIAHDKPIVLLSGGVGITPMSSMAEFLVAQKFPNKVYMVNCSRCPHTAAFGNRFKHLASDDFQVKNVFTSTDDGDAKGPLTAELLKSFVGEHAKNAHYYFCGPPGFMLSVRQILEDWGLPADHIHYEFFGPHDAQ